MAKEAAMSEARHDLFRRLAVYGSDLSRWPDRSGDAKAGLLRDPEFRRAFEDERIFDSDLVEHREMLDREIAGARTVARLKRRLLRNAAGPLAGMDWRRIAAAVIIAGMLGGALDLMLPDAGDQTDIAILDPLDLDAGFE
jgi:hypothetical protein